MPASEAMKGPIQRALLSMFVATTLAWPAGATWSIVVVDRRTGEVGVAAATCLPRNNLLRGLPAVAVGKGAGVIQALSGGEAGLVIIFDGLRNDEPPATILEAVKDADPRPEDRQIGIAGMTGAPVRFTGTGAGRARGGTTGEAGDLAYSIQGNVLTGAEVWLAARDALLQTPGDLGQRLMAAMEAARSLGGDGRCSCDMNRPTRCGAPPSSFEKSAHCGFVVVARMGDTDAACTTGQECAQGNYYLTLNVRGNEAEENDPDPVLQLQGLYDGWRSDKVGHPDGILSTVESVQSMPADGVTTRTVIVRLADIDGTPLTAGGATLTVSTEDGRPSLASVGPVSDHGDGTYSFPLTAGTAAGEDRFVIVASDGASRPATLFPYLTVRSDPVRPLHVGYDRVSAAASPRVPIVLNEPRSPGASYWLFASLSGTQPGSLVREVALPLNPRLISGLRHGVDVAPVPGWAGRLDDRGRAEAAFLPSPPMLSSFVGRRVDWAALVIGEGGVRATNAMGFDVLP